jgi:hypothetical protein
MRPNVVLTWTPVFIRGGAGGSCSSAAAGAFSVTYSFLAAGAACCLVYPSGSAVPLGLAQH